MHREWLRFVEATTGKKLTTLAKAIGIAPSTLTRPVKEGDGGTSTLHATTIQKLVEATGLAAPGVVVAVATSTPLRRSIRHLAEEAVPFDSRAETPLAAAVRAMVAGRPHVMPVTLRTRAIEAAGYFPADVLIYDLNGQAQAGDVVRAQVYDRNGEIEETVWRLYDPPYLVGAALDLSLMPKPLTVTPERVVIMGTVVGMIRPPKERAPIAG
jgi:hypothetical protein